MNRPAVCVVVPVYRAEATLDRCVQSILSQKVAGGVSCVLVDDGSPDASGALCDAWAARDPRVRVIHQEDRGVSSARNAGMAAADSEFLVFLDSDDALRPGALQAALQAQQAAPGDFVLWHYTTGEADPAVAAPDADPRPPQGLARLWLDCLLAMPDRSDSTNRILLAKIYNLYWIILPCCSASAPVFPIVWCAAR